MPDTDKPPERVLGLDYGTRKIGLASGQVITGGATALPALACRNGTPDWDAIEQAVKEWQPQALVVGLPLNMDDSESELSARARRFARQLEGRLGLPVWLVDERLSTREARDRLGERYRGGPDPRVDSEAAALVIESFYQDGGERP